MQNVLWVWKGGRWALRNTEGGLELFLQLRVGCLGPYLSDVPLLNESHSVEKSDEEVASRSTGREQQGWTCGVPRLVWVEEGAF